MKKMILLGLVLGLISLANIAGAQIETLPAKPLTQVVNTDLRPVQGGPLKTFVITWGGDVATIFADLDGIFKDEGLDVSIVVENDFTKQVQALINGEAPCIRGTMDQINTAVEACKAAGIDLVVVEQETWSHGGDCIVVRGNIKTPADLRGKTIALQLYGPHMGYIANVLKAAGVPLSSVRFKWFRELTLPTYDTNGKIVDGVTAFQQDKTIDAVCCISPDMMNLTSGDKVGKGGGSSVLGAHKLLSTATGGHIIADVYAFRSDYYNTHQDQVQHFTYALMRGQEGLQTLILQKASRSTEYQQVISKSADLLFGASTATGDVEGLLDGCEFVNHAGNVMFFTGQGTTSLTMEKFTETIQTAYISMGFLSSRVPLVNPHWDYNALATGLKHTASVAAAVPATPKFDTEKVSQAVERKINAEPTQWEEEGTLFKVEITFEPNQSDFPMNQYAGDFQKALETYESYNGGLYVIEGHSDPLGILKAKEAGKPGAEVSQMEQVAKNLSLQRAEAVKASFIKYAKSKGVSIDVSQFLPVGMGIAAPKYNPPKTKEEWAANRRVVFVLKQVEAESEEFTPLKGK